MDGSGECGEGEGGGDSASQEALDAAHEGVEGRAGVALAKVGRGEAPDKAVDAEAAHGFVAEAKAGLRVTAHDQAPAPDDLAILVEGEAGRPHGLARAAAEDAEVISVLKVLGEHDIAGVEESGERRDREVPDAPGILILVGDAGIEDEAPEGISCLFDCAKGLDEQGERAISGYHFANALPGPGGELGTDGYLRGFVLFPRCVVGPAGRTKGKTGLGHDEPAVDDGRRYRVKGAEASAPLGPGIVDGHDIPGGGLLEADEIWVEAGRKRVASNGVDHARHWGG